MYIYVRRHVHINFVRLVKMSLTNFKTNILPPLAQHTIKKLEAFIRMTHTTHTHKYKARTFSLCLCSIFFSA